MCVHACMCVCMCVCVCACMCMCVCVSVHASVDEGYWQLTSLAYIFFVNYQYHPILTTYNDCERFDKFLDIFNTNIDMLAQ